MEVPGIEPWIPEGNRHYEQSANQLRYDCCDFWIQFGLTISHGIKKKNDQIFVLKISYRSLRFLIFTPLH